MDFKTVLTAATRNARNHGYGAAVYDLGVRFTNRFVTYRCLQCVVIETPDLKYTNLPAPFRYERLRAADLVEYSALPQYELDSEFLREAAAKGDECLAIFHDDVLASYGWYSAKATRVNPELELDFDRAYRYMYKGLTLDSFRGHRLHAVGMTLALASYRSEGCKGLLSYVEAQNFDSLKSCYRMGYRACGHIRFVKVGTRYTIRPSVDCENYRLRLYETDKITPRSRMARAS
jgi:hypothetical protein